MGRHKEAVLVLERAVAIFEARVGSQTWMTATTRASLGEALLAMGQTADGEKALTTAYETLLSLLGPDDKRTRRVAEVIRKHGIAKP